MLTVNTFFELEEQFLKPLIQRRQIHREEIPLEEMSGWNLQDGKLSSLFFEIIGTRTSFQTEADGTTPRSWDQPIYRQGTGTLVLYIDEYRNILIQTVFEPGNATRGYQNRGLTLSNSCKFSPGNLAFLKSQGKIPPLSDLLTHPEAKRHFFHLAPGDSGRADKQNEHHLIELPRKVLEQAVDTLPGSAKEFYALIPLSVFETCYQQALVNEHLRDLASMLLFLKDV